MKNTIVLVAALLGFCLAQTMAQAPKKFKYQAVARDNGGLIKNQDIDIRVHLCPNFSCNNPAFTENHNNEETNEFGLFSIEIGSLNPVAFSQIDWDMGEKWLKVEIRPEGANQYYAMDPVQLLSVPYALYAADGPDADPSNEIQTLSKSGNVVTLTDGGFFIDEVNDADASPTNEIQQLSLSGNTLTISGNGGNAVALPNPHRLAYLKDVKSNTIPGGSVQGEVWLSRTLNTLSGDASFVQLTGGSIGKDGTATQFILQAGTYQFEAYCPGQQINVHVAKLVNLTDNTDVLIGSAGYSPVGTHAITHSIIMGEFTISGPKLFTILQRSGSSHPNGFGVSHWWGDHVYTQVKIQKIN